MNREVGLVRRGTCSRSARCRARTVELARRRHRPGARRARHGVHLRARRPRPAARRRQVGPRAPAAAGAQGQPRRPGRSGLADVGWNSLYWDNHDQPRAVSRFGDDSPEHRVASAKTLGDRAAPAQGTPYVYQGEELGMTNSYFTAIDEYRDIESLNRHHDGAEPGACRPRRCWSRCRPRAATTRAPRCSGTPPSTPASPPARRGCRSTRTRTTINAAAAVADPDSVFHHYRRLIELRHDEPRRRRRPVRAAAARARAAVGVHPHARRRGAAGASRTAPPSRSPSTPSLPALDDATVLLGTHADSTATVLAPWESRILSL